MIILRDKVYLEQREYGLGSDIWHSGLQRTAKKYVGRGRVWLAKGLTKSIKSDSTKMRDAFIKADEAQAAVSRDPKILEKLKESATNEGAMVVPGRLGMTPSRSINPNPDNISGIITLPHDANIAEVSHEIGHLLNTKYGKRAIKTSLLDDKVRSSYNRTSNLVGAEGNNRRIGLGKVFRDWRKSRIILSEEARASSRGRKLLKEIGTPIQDMDRVRAAHNAELETYKLGGRTNWKNTLRNTVQIPSRVKTADGKWVDSRIDLLPDKERIAWNRNQYNLRWG